MHPIGVKLYILCMSVMGGGDNHPHTRQINAKRKLFATVWSCFFLWKLMLQWGDPMKAGVAQNI